MWKTVCMKYFSTKDCITNMSYVLSIKTKIVFKLWVWWNIHSHMSGEEFTKETSSKYFGQEEDHNMRRKTKPNPHNWWLTEQKHKFNIKFLSTQEAHLLHLTQLAARNGNLLNCSSSSLTVTAYICHLTEHQHARADSIIETETLTCISSQFKNKRKKNTQKKHDKQKT